MGIDFGGALASVVCNFALGLVMVVLMICMGTGIYFFGKTEMAIIVGLLLFGLFDLALFFYVKYNKR